MAITQKPYGQLQGGREASLFTIAGTSGASLTLSDLGARIVGIVVPDRQGNLADVVLGCTDAAGNIGKGRYFGAVCGRFANRLRAAQFQLNGKTYHLAANNGKNSLHGGEVGYDVALWQHRLLSESSIAFIHQSPDGDEGYPGNLTVTVTYTFTGDNTVRIDYHAVCDADTVINLTNHAFFNLEGHDAGPVADHLLQIEADYYTPVDGEAIPHGEVAPVAGTPFDFRQPVAIGAREDADVPQMQVGGGYDHNFVLAKTVRNALERAATVTGPKSGRVMEVVTTKPGVQFYGGNFIDNLPGKDGAIYPWRGGFCLETQYFPNAVEVCHFPSPVLAAGEVYSHTTEYRFSVAE